jgi:hypothetical protein
VVEQQVRGLDVPVDDAVTVRVVEATGRLEQAIDRLLDRQPPLLADDRGQVLSGNVFHDQEVRSLHLVGIVGGDDVGMAQPGGRLDLAKKPLQSNRILDELGR